MIQLLTLVLVYLTIQTESTVFNASYALKLAGEIQCNSQIIKDARVSSAINIWKLITNETNTNTNANCPHVFVNLTSSNSTLLGVFDHEGGQLGSSTAILSQSNANYYIILKSQKRYTLDVKCSQPCDRKLRRRLQEDANLMMPLLIQNNKRLDNDFHILIRRLNSLSDSQDLDSDNEEDDGGSSDSESDDKTQNPTQNPIQPTQAPSQDTSQTPTQDPSQTPTQNPTQTPTQNPTQTPSHPTCFGGSNMVTIKRDDFVSNIKLSDLMVGDEIYGRNIYNISSDVEWTKVWYIDYHNNETMLNIGYKCTKHQKDLKHIYITEDHLLYKFDQVQREQMMVMAKEIILNDYLMVYNEIRGSVLKCKVLNIDYIWDMPMYPLTVSGDIIVSNVVASSYANSKQNAFYIHSLSEQMKFEWFFPLNKVCKPCFGGTNDIVVKREGVIQMIKLYNLLIGDKVKGRDIYNSSDKIKWSYVWYIETHENMLMLDIEYNCKDIAIANKHIYMTDQHLLYKFDNITNTQIMIKASHIQLNDKLMVYINGKVYSFCKVISIGHILDKPISPLTIDGDIVVSNVIASSYTQSKEHALKLHSMAKDTKFTIPM